jgi:hypothetical protein
MALPAGKPPFKEEETSMPKENVIEPTPSQSVHPKEVTSKAAAEASSLELRATKAIQQEPVVVLENGRSRSRCIRIATDKVTHLMLRSSPFPRPAIRKFKNVYEQIECEFIGSILLGGLWNFALFFRHTDDDTLRQRYIEKEIEIAMWFGPVSQLGCWRGLLYRHMLLVPTEWRVQVQELVMALKVLTAVQASLMFREMWDLLCPRPFRRLLSRPALTYKKGKEERCAETESTDSDSSSTY